MAIDHITKKDVLFICVSNGSRSQMAEEFVRLLSGGEMSVESAGFEAGDISPETVEVMREVGVDLSAKKTQNVFELFKKGHMYHYVISVCHESEDLECPVFPGMTHRLHLPFPDPGKLSGTQEEKLAKVREIRDEIRKIIQDFIDWTKAPAERRLGNVWEKAAIVQEDSREAAE